MSSISYSSFLDNGNFSTETASALDWLDVTETLGLSFNQVQIDIGVGGDLEGWCYATGDEFDQLLINLGFTAGACASGQLFCVFSQSFTVQTAPIVELLGDTSGLGFSSDPAQFRGWSRGRLADVQSHGVNWGGIVDWDGLNTYHFTAGVNQGVVPIPAAAWLFGSALLGLVGLKRKK